MRRLLSLTAGTAAKSHQNNVLGSNLLRVGGHYLNLLLTVLLVGESLFYSKQVTNLLYFFFTSTFELFRPTIFFWHKGRKIIKFFLSFEQQLHISVDFLTFEMK